MEEKYDGTHYVFIYLIGYAFYTYQVLSQLLYSQYSLAVVLPFSIALLFLPLTTFYICKKLNNRVTMKPKVRFIFNLISILYLIVVNLIALNYVSVMIHNYYYQSVQCYIIAFFVMLPAFYASLKKSKVFYSLAFILTIFFFIFKSIYMLTHKTTDFYPLYNIFTTDNLLICILLSIPLILEPFILLSNSTFINIEKKINTKLVVAFSCFVSIIGIYTLIRETMEFGLLLNTLSFPYFESFKLFSLQSNFDNFDYYYLLSITITLFARIPLMYFTIKDNVKLNNKYTVAFYILILIAFYFLQMKLDFYINILTPTLIITSCLLILLAILGLIFTRRKNNVSQ